MFRRKSKIFGLIALAVAFTFMFSAVASAAVPVNLYFKSGDEMVKVDYAKAVSDAQDEDSTLYEAVVEKIGEAEGSGAAVVVETDEGIFLDWQKALMKGARFAEIVDDETYKTAKPEYTKELQVKDGEAIIDDPIGEIVDDGLKVESVSAINNTKQVKVTVDPGADFEAATVTVFAYDEDGEREAALDSKDITDEDINEEGKIVVEFDFVAVTKGDYVAVVTVDEDEVAEKEFDVDFTAENEAVEAVNDAKTNVALWNALQNELFEGVAIEANIVKYKAKLEVPFNTVAEVIEAVKEINEEVATEGEFEALKEALEAAKDNDLAVYNILKDKFGDIVKADNIEEYIAKIFNVEDEELTTVKLGSIEEIQDAIDEVNKDVADEAAAKVVRELIDELPEVITLEDKADVVAARAAYEALTEDQQVLVTNVDVLVAAEDAIVALEDEAAAAINNRINYVQLYGSINKGSQPNKHYVGFSSDYKLNYADGEKIVSFVYELYRGEELLATIEPTERQLEDMNNFLGDAGNEGNTFTSTTTFDIYNERESGSWSQDKGWIENNPYNFPTEVKLTIEYSDGEVVKRTANLPTSGVNEVKQELTRRLVNDAETEEDVNAALLGEPVSEYLNTPGADRLFVAKKVLEARNEVVDTKKFADYSDLTTALDAALETRTEALDGVNNTLNADSKISDVIDVLEAVSAEFAEMTNAEKADIAEAFFLGLEFVEEAEDGEPTLKTPFRTLAAVKAAAGL